MWHLEHHQSHVHHIDGNVVYAGNVTQGFSSFVLADGAATVRQTTRAGLDFLRDVDFSRAAALVTRGAFAARAS